MWRFRLGANFLLISCARNGKILRFGRIFWLVNVQNGGNFAFWKDFLAGKCAKWKNCDLEEFYWFCIECYILN
jgi:hypothetical protein